MYTAPATPEQCLHNTLILVKAMRSVGIDYDIQATDITDPNPIALLMVRKYIHNNMEVENFIKKVELFFWFTELPSQKTAKRPDIL